MRGALRALILGSVALCATPLAFAGRVHWPAAGPGHDAPVDPIQGVRWNNEGWVLIGTAAPAQIALSDLDGMLAVRPESAALHGDRAVVLRVLQRFDEARAELARTIALDPRVTDDPDIALTDAYLAARSGHFDDAVTAARRALPRLDGSDELRGQLVLEIARWSMARGPDGLDDAVSLLREVSGPSASAAVARATLALALHRRGREDEAREVAQSADLPSPYTSTTLRPGAVIDGETDAALGTAYLLAGRGYQARTFLEAALDRAPHVWRASIEASLAEARRAAAPSVVAPLAPPRRGLFP